MQGKGEQLSENEIEIVLRTILTVFLGRNSRDVQE